MTDGKIVISGTGCALADYLFTGIAFNSPAFLKFQSKSAGDGGLSPGRLVFTEELEQFSSKPYPDIFREITGGRAHHSVNIGGPGLVSLINTAQLLDPARFETRYYGGSGHDETADFIFGKLENTPLNIQNYKRISDKFTPFTHVLSDPTYDHNHGERTFINNIGAAWDFSQEYLNDDFFNSDIVCFGGTALVPQIHDNLGALLRRAKEKGCITVVNTVFDFRNEKKNPGKPWPLGDSRESLRLIDLLIMDCEESLRISGCLTINDAAGWFRDQDVPAFIITNGKRNLLAASNGKLFRKTGILELPVSAKVVETINNQPEMKGDTTGCGDNFAGGAIAAIATQMAGGRKTDLDFKEAIAWAVASGGFACFYVGGTYHEKTAGEKLGKIRPLISDYTDQISRL